MQSNKTAYVLADNESPECIAHLLYNMLTEENKEKVNRFVESLKAKQCTPTP